MPRRADPDPQPDLPYDRAIPALQRQLERLQQLRNRTYEEADSDENRWQHLTESIIERTFGKNSTNLSKFNDVSWIGTTLFRGEMPGYVLQSNFERRIAGYEALLTSIIDELRLYVPEQPIKGVYEPGDRYAVYRDISTIFAVAAREVIVVDAYLDEQLFNLYVDKVGPGVPVQVLTNKIGQNVEAVAQMYSARRPLELRASADVHDRLVFVDDRGWVIGQSLKDAAKTKPTYVVEVEGPVLAGLRTVYSGLWSRARVLL